MAEKAKAEAEKDINNKKPILPSYINKEYLEKKYNDLKEDQEEKSNDDFNNNKIIIENKKLTIIEVDKTKNVENKIYESDDFTQVIKELTKIEKISKNFTFDLIKNMKNEIFIIESEDIVTYGAFFFFKYNKSNNKIEIISEKGNRQIKFITEYSDGNFAYNCYIHRPIYTDDAIYVFKINSNKKYKLKSFGEYDNIFNSKFISLTNGFAFNNILCVNENNQARYLNIVEGFVLKRYIIDSIYGIKQLTSDDKYIYFLREKRDDLVYIYDIENKKFYYKNFKNWYEMEEPKEIVFDEKKEKEEKEEEEEEKVEVGGENENNLGKKKKKKCIIF